MQIIEQDGVPDLCGSGPPAGRRFSRDNQNPETTSCRIIVPGTIEACGCSLREVIDGDMSLADSTQMSLGME